MLHLRVNSPAHLTDAVVEMLRGEAAVSSLAVVRGASLEPPGDLVFADIARETANDVVDRLRAMGLHHHGSIQIEPMRTWLSQAGFEAEQEVPGSGADAVVWADVVQRAYEESELTFTFLSFMVLATLIASVGIILDSQILLIGAMVLGPEFGAITALGLGLVRKRPRLLQHALRTLVVGFAAAILGAALLLLVGRTLGWVVLDDVVGPRPGTGFIYQPDRWSLVVAVIAGVAGVLSLTSARGSGLVGVFISVTTIPAAGNVALGLAFGVPSVIWGSTVQLVVNVTGMAVAGWATLALQQVGWGQVTGRWSQRSRAGRSARGLRRRR